MGFRLGDEAVATGEAMHRLAGEFYPICRSITGNGVRETLRRLQAHLPLVVHEVPSGTRVFDWIVPREWGTIGSITWLALNQPNLWALGAGRWAMEHGPMATTASPPIAGWSSGEASSVEALRSTRARGGATSISPIASSVAPINIIPGILETAPRIPVGTRAACLTTP